MRELRCRHGGFNGAHAGGACVRMQVCLELTLLKVALVSYWRVLALVRFYFLNRGMDILRKVIFLKRTYHISHPE